MKTIYKTIAIFLLAGTGVDSAQAQNGSSQTWTLRQCIDYAIEHNINIRQTANEAEQNKVDVNTAKWARLPNLSGSAVSYTHLDVYKRQKQTFHVRTFHRQDAQ